MPGPTVRLGRNAHTAPFYRRSLLKHHWIEEAQHAKLDGLILKSLAESSSPEGVATAIQEYFEIGSFLDAGLFQQTELDLESLERAIDRRLSQDHRRQFLDVQHGALRWTFLGSAMGNRNFLAVLASVSDEAARIVCGVFTAVLDLKLHADFQHLSAGYIKVRAGLLRVATHRREHCLAPAGHAALASRGNDCLVARKVGHLREIARRDLTARYRHLQAFGHIGFFHKSKP